MATLKLEGRTLENEQIGQIQVTEVLDGVGTGVCTRETPRLGEEVELRGGDSPRRSN